MAKYEPDFMMSSDPSYALSLHFMLGAPPIDRNDAPVAAAITNRIIHAEDLQIWDGTIEDLAGYLRMMGSLITGYLEMREIMPETEEMTQKFRHMGGVSEIFNIFLAGETGRDKTYTTGTMAGDEKARQKLQSYDPAIRDVVSACATLKLIMVSKQTQKGFEMALGLFKPVMDKLQGFNNTVPLDQLDFEGIDIDDESGDMTLTDKVEALTAKRLAFLQQAVEDQLGVTPDELNMSDVLFYCQWRFAAGVLGIDSKFTPRLWNQSPADLMDLGMKLFQNVSSKRGRYLPPVYDRAMHMASDPNFYAPRYLIDRTLPHYSSILLTYGHEEGGRAWSQLRLQCAIAQGVIAGGIKLPRSDAASGQQDIENDADYFTAGQLLPHVEGAEVLLERLRPWLGDNEELQKLDKEVQGWREKYITGKEENELQNAIFMRGSTSQGSSGCDVATTPTDPSIGLDVMLERMRQVAQGEIDAPTLTRDDAASALYVCGDICQAPDLWDGTLKDIAGYLRMMGSLIKGMLRIKEVMPPTSNRPQNPRFDRYVSWALFAGTVERKPGKPIFEHFIAGNPKKEPPAIRDVVKACASVHLITLMDGVRKGDAEKAIALFSDAIDVLSYNTHRIGNAELEASFPNSGNSNSRAPRDERANAKLNSLQKSIKDKLGVTRDELDLMDVQAYAHWRCGAAILGIDNYFREEIDLTPEAVIGGTRAIQLGIIDRPTFLPLYYDQALYMASKPSNFSVNVVLQVALGGLSVARSSAGAGAGPLVQGPWAQLRLWWIAAKAVVAGAQVMFQQEGQRRQADEDANYFIARQLLTYITGAEELLDRLRPWACANAEFNMLEKDIKGWREKYITGKDINEHQNSVPMKCVTSQWVPRDGERECATCENISDKLKACSACKQVWYCNAACQKAGWRAHKKSCASSKKT